MDLNLVSGLDVLSAAAFLAAFLVVTFVPTRRDGLLQWPAKVCLMMCLLLYAFVGLSNVLEHGGISAALDERYEDNLEILFSPLLLYSFYSVFATVELRKRERAERYLRHELDMLGAVIDVSPIAVVVTDGEGRIAFANEIAESLLRLEPGDAGMRLPQGCRWSRLDGAEGSSPLEQVAATGASITDEGYRVHMPDGTRITVEVRSTPVLDEDGGVKGIVATLQRLPEDLSEAV